MRRDRCTFLLHSWLTCLVILGTTLFNNVSAHSATWQPGPPLNTARNQFAGGVIDGNIYVFGGNRYPDERDLRSMEMLDPVKGKWVYRENGPAAVEEVSGAVVDGKLYVFGSCSGDFAAEYDPEKKTWTPKAPMPTPRADAVAVAYNSKIYVFGGGYEDHTVSDVVEVYDPSTDTWQPEPVTHMPKAIDRPIVSVVDNKAYVFCGRSEPEKQTLSDVSAYNFTTNTWTTNGLLPVPHPREIGSSTPPVVNGKIYLIGGGKWTQGYVEAVEEVDIYDPASNTWQTGTPLPTPTGSYVSAVVDGMIYVIGGGSVSGPTAAVWKYSLVNHKPTIGALLPSSKTSPPAVAQTFTATYKDIDGCSDIKLVDFLVTPTGTGINAIWARYNSATNKLNLYDDTGTAFVSPSCSPGTAGTLQNSHGKILCGATTVSKTVDSVIVKWRIVPKSAFASPTAKKIRMIARDKSNTTSNWVTKGTWAIQP